MDIKINNIYRLQGTSSFGSNSVHNCDFSDFFLAAPVYSDVLFHLHHVLLDISADQNSLRNFNLHHPSSVGALATAD